MKGVVPLMGWLTRLGIAFLSLVWSLFCLAGQLFLWLFRLSPGLAIVFLFWLVAGLSWYFCLWGNGWMATEEFGWIVTIWPILLFVFWAIKPLFVRGNPKAES